MRWQMYVVYFLRDNTAFRYTMSLRCLAFIAKLQHDHIHDWPPLYNQREMNLEPVHVLYQRFHFHIAVHLVPRLST